MKAFKSFATGGGAIVQDPDANKTASSKDGKYQCQNGSIPYQQTIQPDQVAPAVFVSPVLLRQIAEQQVRLARVRVACARLIQAYDYQQDILASQDKLSLAQKAAATLSSELENDRFAKDGFGTRVLTAAEAAQFGIAAGTVRDSLKLSHENALAIGDQLRAMYKTQVTDVDYRKQFDDAALAIDLQLRELARSLFILDRSVVPNLGVTVAPQGYGDGSWVKQGTVVLAAHPWNSR